MLRLPARGGNLAGDRCSCRCRRSRRCRGRSLQEAPCWPGLFQLSLQRRCRVKEIRLWVESDSRGALEHPQISELLERRLTLWESPSWKIVPRSRACMKSSRENLSCRPSQEALRCPPQRACFEVSVIRVHKRPAHKFHHSGSILTKNSGTGGVKSAGVRKP